jgi:FixJ family two-component response regulator
MRLASRMPAPPTAADASDHPTIFVVEDDFDLGEILARCVSGGGYRTAVCRSAAEAIEAIAPRAAGCVLIDLHLPDRNGLELRRDLLARGCRQPFIVLTGSRDVGLAVRSIQEGAVDFLQKPVPAARLLACVGRAVARDRESRRLETRIEALTRREREILEWVSAGRASKEIARAFGISPRTVDVHRHNILKKMQVESAIGLVRLLSQRNAIGAAPGGP